jgi:hypothetical protein
MQQSHRSSEASSRISTLESRLACLLVTACSTTSVIDRSTLAVSDNSRVVAANAIPHADRYPKIVDHLGLAQEAYQSQLANLKRRKLSLRTRNRTFQALSYGTFALTTLGVGIAAIATAGQEDAAKSLRTAGYSAIGGTAAGTLFQFAGFMQEDPDAIDGKIRRLEIAYLAMLDRVRSLSNEPEDQAALTGAAMSQAIETFIAQAVEIDARG